MKPNFFTRTLTACQEWLRRLAIRQIIKLVDRAEDRLQAWQVSLRETLVATQASAQGAYRANVLRAVAPINETSKQPTWLAKDEASGESRRARLSPGETFDQWTLRRAGVAPASKKAAKQRKRMTAAEFDRSVAWAK